MSVKVTSFRISKEHLSAFHNDRVFLDFAPLLPSQILDLGYNVVEKVFLISIVNGFFEKYPINLNSVSLKLASSMLSAGDNTFFSRSDDRFRLIL